MPEYYTPAEVAEITGASRPAIRTYAIQYSRYFNPEATPEAGRARRFTEADAKLIAFIRERTQQNLTHAEVTAQLAAGELENFAWELPERYRASQSAQSATEERQAGSAALVPVERLQAAHALMQDAQRREQQAAEQVQALTERIEALQRDLGAAQGELAAYKQLRPRRPAWLQWLIGGPGAE